MLGKLSVALLLAAVAAPAAAAGPESDIKVDESGQAYRIKKVCRTVEVAGSFIPRRSCVNRKVPITKPVTEAPADGPAPSGGDNAAPQKEQEEQ